MQLWHIDLAHKVLRPITFWDAPHGAADTGVSHDVLGFCSSHWFTMNSHKIVADAWYSAGVRFLDISDPKHIRPVGFYAGDANVASQAVFFPGRDDIVYVADYIRGLDVVKLDKGGVGAVTVNAPLVPSRSGSLLKPSSELGWICAQLDTAPGRSGSAFGLGFTASAGS